MDFKEYINFLYTNGLLGLGKIANPITNKEEKNLPLVQYTIDILKMLEEKTKGNLTDEEESLLIQVITTLQLNYVQEMDSENENNNNNNQ